MTIHHNENQKELAQKITDELLQKDIKLGRQKPAKIAPLIYETETSWS